VKQYKVGDSLGWYKLHYDMLLMLEPKIHEDANGNVCKIEYYSDYDGDKHIEAWPMEGDLWEHSLTKEILVADDVTKLFRNLQLAVCGIHLFYGFTPQTQDQCFDDMFSQAICF
jgi:hypothetical protein